VADERLGDERLYFICESCGHRIVINRKKNRWFSFSPLAGDTLWVSDLPDGIFLSFNTRGVFSAFLFIIAWSVLALMLFIIARSSILFFMRHPYMAAFLVFIVSMVFIFSCDLLKYHLSKNSLSLIERNAPAGGIWKSGRNEIAAVGAVSTGAIILFTALILPILLLKTQFGLVYAGFLHGPLFILTLLMVFILFFKRLIISFMATRSGSAGEKMTAFGRFFAVENINLFIYSFLSRMITLALIFCSGIFLFRAALFLMASLSAMLVPEILVNMKGFISSMPGGMHPHLSGLLAEKADYFHTGMIFMAFWCWLILAFFVAFIINLDQTLTVVSLKIMESNPGRSINRNAILIALALLAILAAAVLLKTLKVPGTSWI
jgi:hypothetical protein